MQTSSLLTSSLKIYLLLSLCKSHCTTFALRMNNCLRWKMHLVTWWSGNASTVFEDLFNYWCWHACHLKLLSLRICETIDFFACRPKLFCLQIGCFTNINLITSCRINSQENSFFWKTKKNLTLNSKPIYTETPLKHGLCLDTAWRSYCHHPWKWCFNNSMFLTFTTAFF